MKNSKKGFTLSEVLIVVAIIVIVSAAGMAGIAIAVQDANARGEKIQQLHGEGNWEAEANQKIKENVPIAGDDEVLEESLDTPTPTAGATSDSETLDEGSSTTDGGSTGGTTDGSTGGSTDTDTGSTNSDTNTNTNTNTNTDVNTNTNTGSNVVTATNTSTNAEGSSVSAYNDWGSCGQSKITLPDKCTEVTLYVPDGVSLTNCWENGLEQPKYTQDGNYVTITCKPTSSLQFQANWSSSTKDGIKVYSYKTS